MERRQEGLLQAREFAELAGVTVRALHHYDRIGILRPTHYTEAGYRLYGERDFARLQQIVTLKFIGLSLKQIRALLDARELDLAETLRMQRDVLGARRRQLDAALRAVEEAERAVSEGGPAWGALRKVIEVINMEQNMDWIKKYYTEEQLADLARRGTPEVLEQGQRDWAALLKEVEEAERDGVEPSSERAQRLAARWRELIERFTGGDPGIAESLRKVYADQSNWPADFKRPYTDDAASFISRANAARKQES
ncbi:MAG TPA: MerR family transcriptional regulator [Pyrinomonadaceae bacterium]|nr:MerR family transcriptional regulator [Pyrinomonadaceae bacterium]